MNFVFTGDHPGRVVTASYTDGELYKYSLSRGEEDLLSTPKRSLDRKILWMDGTMTLGRPRHIVQRSISGKGNFRCCFSFILHGKNRTGWLVWEKQFSHMKRMGCFDFFAEFKSIFSKFKSFVVLCA